MLQASGVGLWDWDLLTNAVYFSPEWKQQLGYADHELPNRLEEWEQRLHPSDLEPTLTAVQDFRAGRRAAYDLEFRLRHKDGSWRWISARANFARDAAGAPVRMMGCHFDITGKKHAESALSESEERLGYALEATRDGLWDWDIVTGNVHFSPQWMRLLGYAPGEVPGRVEFFYTIVHPDDVDRVRQALADHLDGRTPVKRCEVRLRMKSGAYRWFLDRGEVVVRDAGGGALRMVGTITDITERKNAEALLGLQKGVLERIAAGAPLAESLTLLARVLEAQAEDMLCSILLLSNDGRHLTHGAAPSLPEEYCRAIDGMAIGDVAGSCGTAAFRREPVIVEDIAADPLWTDFRARALPHGLRACWSTPIMNPEQRVLGTFAIYQRQPGRPTAQHRQLIALATDIAAIAIGRHEIEASLILSDAALKSISQGVLITDTDGQILAANAAFSRITGFGAEELVGRDCAHLQGPNRDPEMLEAKRLARQNGVEFAREILETRKDGSTFWNDLTITPVRDAGGRLTHFIGITRDVTERKQIENELRLFRSLWDQSNDTLEIIDPATSRFLDVNAKGPAELGCSREEYLSRRVIDIDPTMTEEGWRNLVSDLRANGSHRGDGQHRRMDGSIFPIEFSSKWVHLDRSYVVAVIRDVSERAARMAALRASEGRLREAQSISRVGNFDWHARTNKVIWSDELFRIYGHLPGGFEPTFESYVAAVHPDDRPQVLQTLQLALEAKGMINHEYRIALADGQVRWVHARGRVTVDGEGNLAGMEGTCQDITEQKNATAALQASERELRLITNKMPGPVARVDRNLRYLFVNDKYERSFGKPREWVLGRAMPEVLGPELFQQVEPYTRRALAGEAVTFESHFRSDARDEVFALVHYIPDVDQAKNVAGFFVVGFNITERKRAEAALRVSDVAMRAVSQGVLVTTPDGCILSANRAFTDITGHAEAEIIGRNCQFLVENIGDPQIVQSIRAARQQGVEFRGEILDRRKDGTEFWNEITITPARDAQGCLTHFIGVTRDITARKLADAASEMLEARLRESQKMEAIGTLAGGIAHDFNNILAIILGNTELAREDAASNPVTLRGLDEIRKAGVRARDLVRQILSFSRRQSTNRKVVALAPVVEEAARLLRATLPARVALEVQCDSAMPAVLADATQMQQVLINLATNATQAMAGRPGRIVIRLDSVVLDDSLANTHPMLHAMHEKQPGRCVRLTVSDDGPGMDAATLTRIFEPFFTTKPVGQGTGLGLSVVHGIVRGHGGAIVVDSSAGQGATFCIYLPLDDTRAGAPAAKSAPSLAPVGGGQHILYVDDEEGLVHLVKRVLERSGFRVSAFTQAREALEALVAHPLAFDLVVTDYNMPGMSGLDVARKVRELRADLPVAVVSGFVDETLSTEAAGAGVREVIFKTIELKDFCAAVQRLARSVA